MTSTDPIVVSVLDGVATCTINRPSVKNALDVAGWRALRDALRGIADLRDVSVVVLTGGGRDFCAGADLKENPRESSAPPPLMIEQMEVLADLAAILQRLPLATIARVQGVAVGGGSSLALGCDLVLTDETARFGFGFGRIALSPDLGASWLLPRLVGLRRAQELMLSGRMVGAEEAERIGLSTRCVAAAQLDELVTEFVTMVRKQSPSSLRHTRRLISESFEHSFQQMVDREGVVQSLNVRSKDFREAITAFGEGRPPMFTGR